jgi:hypothetical protein
MTAQPVEQEPEVRESTEPAPRPANTIVEVPARLVLVLDPLSGELIIVPADRLASRWMRP